MKVPHSLFIELVGQALHVPPSVAIQELKQENPGLFHLLMEEGSVMLDLNGEKYTLTLSIDRQETGTGG